MIESVQGFTAWMETNHGWLLLGNALEQGRAQGYEWQNESEVDNHIERLLNDYERSAQQRQAWNAEHNRICNAIEAADRQSNYTAAERLSRELLEHQAKEPRP
jgi:hypothetical protein